MPSDKPPFAETDWVVWDDHSEPVLGVRMCWMWMAQCWGAPDYGIDDIEFEHMRLATVSDFDAAIAWREAKLTELRTARMHLLDAVHLQCGGRNCA